MPPTAPPLGIPPNTDNDGAPAAATGCSVVLPQLAPGETQLYTLEIAPKAEMSLLFVMRTRGGSALM